MHETDTWKKKYPFSQLSTDCTVFWLKKADNIPLHFWEQQKNVFQGREWFTALETLSYDGFEVGLLVLVKNGQIVAYTMVQFVFVPFSQLQPHIPSWVAAILVRIPYFTSLWKGQRSVAAAVVGDLLITAAKPETNHMELILAGLAWLRKENFKAKTTLFHICKDIQTNDQETHQLFVRGGFHQCFSDPEMILELNKKWMTGDHYVQDLHKKYRQRYRSARKKGIALRVREITRDEIIARKDELQMLLNNVIERRDFILIKENIEFYLQCYDQLGENFHFRIYELDEKIVGFATAIQQENTLIAHRVGIDYERNNSHKLYQNILYDYIEQAIQGDYQKLSLGRTATEIKSAVGAKPQYLHIFVRHPMWLLNLFLKFALRSVSKPQWIWRNALQSTVITNPSTEESESHTKSNLRGCI